MVLVVLASVFFLAFFNGANDNFKGVATLYGSRTASYRTSLIWATLTTGAGAVLAPVIAAGLIAVFKAKGLVPDDVAASKPFLASATLAAAATVALATRIGLPVSTTHALTGGLVGAGLVAAGSALNLKVLTGSFVAPLLIGPFVAAFIAALIGTVVLRVARALDVKGTDCVCVGTDWVPVSIAVANRTVATAEQRFILTTGEPAVCVRRYSGKFVGISVQRIVDTCHFLSGGAVSFARGVNDAPKILALALGARLLGGNETLAIFAIAGVMAIGGLLFSRQVAETMSNKVSQIDPRTGLVANVVAATLVITGSVFKLPLSTTHVTTGGIVGVGATEGKVAWGMFGKIALAWVTTLPLAAAFGAGLYLFVSRWA